MNRLAGNAIIAALAVVMCVVLSLFLLGVVLFWNEN
jgi:hypothetical protein